MWKLILYSCDSDIVRQLEYSAIYILHSDNVKVFSETTHVRVHSSLIFCSSVPGGNKRTRIHLSPNGQNGYVRERTNFIFPIEVAW